MAHQVFISYASLDKNIADAVCATLESNHISCWMAPRNILPGVDFAGSIIDAIENSRVLVLILSSNSSISPHVLREINKAASSRISILSFITEEVVLSKSMEYYLSTDHWLDASTPPLSRHIQTLALTVEKLLKEIDKNEESNYGISVQSRLKEMEHYSAHVHHEVSPEVAPPTLQKPSQDMASFPKITSQDIASSPVKINRDAASHMLKKDKKEEIRNDNTEQYLVVSSHGPYPSIMAAIAAASPGQTIKIKSGTYREKIFLDKAVKLHGEGRETVKLSFDSDTLLDVDGKKGTEIKGISFTLTGSKTEHPVCVLRGPLIMQDCRITGGEKGIHIYNGSPLIKGNTIERNRSGIYVDAGSTPVLEENQCNNNNCGIFYAEQSGGKALKNQCRKNTLGITVSDRAQPDLLENICNENREAGINYIKSGKGKAEGNECKKNINGIVANENSSPVLQRNCCTENREAGIFYTGRAAGKALANECIRNNSHGIQVSQKGQPLLEGNQCTRNKLMGIAYFDNSAGIARYNHCVKNELHGILLRAEALPNLEGNQCNENREAGIAYFDNARGLARGNVCRGNRVTDIAVNGQATPIIG
ncbi:MAG: right-handed parallel beta-helix repeat-containing protein [Syntrophomonas sp.]